MNNLSKNENNGIELIEVLIKVIYKKKTNLERKSMKSLRQIYSVIRKQGSNITMLSSREWEKKLKKYLEKGFETFL